jgi:hypothetical protein
VRIKKKGKDEARDGTAVITKKEAKEGMDLEDKNRSTKIFFFSKY